MNVYSFIININLFIYIYIYNELILNIMPELEFEYKMNYSVSILELIFEKIMAENVVIIV